jgi:hypothetical protein
MHTPTRTGALLILRMRMEAGTPFQKSYLLT